MNTFTPSFKQAVNRVAEELGLLEATNSRHEKNGTIAYTDPVTGCTYTLHTNGYIRRTTRYFSRHGSTFRQVYQLNPTRKVRTGEGKWNYYTERVMMSPWEQLGKLTSCTISFRETRWQQN